MTPPSNGGLACFNDPEVVTVVGASDDPAKWGYWMANGAVRGAHRRAVNLVNRRRREILGRPSVGSLAEVDGPLGLVVLCVPARELVSVVGQALDLGASGFVGITAGLDHALDGPGAERELAAEIRARGARLVGPNCLGVYDAATDLRLAWGEFASGRLAVVSQSDQVGSELADLAAACGLGSLASSRSATRSTSRPPRCWTTRWTTRRPRTWRSTWRASATAGGWWRACAGSGRPASRRCC